MKLRNYGNVEMRKCGIREWRYALAFCIFSCLHVFVFSYSAEGAEKFAYRGRLERTDGSLFNAALPMTMSFRLYDGESGGSPLWGRTLPVRVETNGTFYVELSDEKGSPSDRDLPYGEIADAFASGDGNFWIGLTPGDYSELVPRQKLASVPRALHAVSASKIESLKADALKADAFTAGTATVCTLTVTNAFRLTETRDLIAEEGKTLEISAVNDIKILNSIWITTKYDVNIGSGTASSDMIIIWKSPTATGGTPAALFYPKGATLENLGGFAIVYKLGE